VAHLVRGGKYSKFNIRAAEAATQLVEYETGIELDAVFLQQRQIFLFEGHLPMMFLLGMDVLHHRREIRFAHADCCTTAANGIFRSVAGGVLLVDSALEFNHKKHEGPQSSTSGGMDDAVRSYTDWDIKCQQGGN